jgi:hypothetical protein
MPSTYGQANWFIFGSYIRLLQRGRLPGQVLNNSLSILAGWFMFAGMLFAELYYWYNDILLSGAALFLMLAATPILQLTAKKTRPATGTKGGWTGFGVSGAQWATVIIIASIVATALSLTGGLSWILSAVSPKPTVTPTSAISVLPPGFAYCPGLSGPGPSGSYAYGSQPSNCLPIGMNLQLGLRNAASTSALSGWTCQVIWGTGNVAVGGVAPGTPGTIAETVANTGANGNCVTSQNLYYPSWSLGIRICHQTTACSQSSYAQQEYVSVLPFPGGTVPFYYGTQAPTSTWTQPAVVNVVPMAGDLAASNTPEVGTFQSQNGTVIATAKTCYVNLANGNGGLNCFYGTGVYINSFTEVITNTYSTSTFPYIAGYTPFSDPILNLPSLGTLTTNLQLEVKQTGGSNPICTVTGGGGSYGFSNGPYVKAASVPDVIYATGDLSSGLTVNRVSGYSTISSGSVNIPFTANCQTLTAAAHADTDTFTFNLYTYYSVSWVSGNSGTLNTITAQTQMSQFVITMSS